MTSKIATERETHDWWLVGDDGRPGRHTGYRCSPENPDYWWFPSHGYSVPESKLYGNAAGARRAALNAALAERDRLDGLIADLSSTEEPSHD